MVAVLAVDLETFERRNKRSSSLWIRKLQNGKLRTNFDSGKGGEFFEGNPVSKNAEGYGAFIR